ncbi:MAG TPA: acyl-CoA dehydratase activase-related protein [Candidatus Nanopelagicaceae bacterium]|nr:acyl-CoA dehydratase activase-related protein [Candidatus Nanopelagicaceae bacterium]
MGPNWVAFKTLFTSLDLDVVIPDPTNREAIKIGVKQSPEFVCFPFKATIGDFVNAIEKGADTLVMAIDCGPCRFGFYASVQERILKDMGYKNITLIPLDQADLLEFNWVKTLQELSGRRDLFIYSKFVKAVIFFLKKAKLLNDMQTAEGVFRAYERNQGDTTKIFNNLLTKLDESNTLPELRKFKNLIKHDFNELDIDKTRSPLKVGLSGEIHISLEPYVNLDIRRKLGEMGIEIHQSLSLYDWVVHKFHLNYHRKWLEHLSHPYMPMDIGGEARWVLGEYIDKAQAGFDGFVHEYPFLCMPEVTARTIITNKLKKIYDLPIIYFSFDEQSGMEGFRTRLEAFADLMNGRRKQEIRETEKFRANGNKKIYPHYGDIFYNECNQFIQNSIEM